MSDTPTDIQIGDRVRSHDFPGKIGLVEEFYIEGEVMDILEHDGCMKYEIWADRRVWNGHTTRQGVPNYFYAPVNGTKTLLGGTCNGVVKLSDTELLANSLMVTCDYCKLKTPVAESHWHSGLGKWICEEYCWDTRLESTK